MEEEVEALMAKMREADGGGDLLIAFVEHRELASMFLSATAMTTEDAQERHSCLLFLDLMEATRDG